MGVRCPCARTSPSSFGTHSGSSNTPLGRAERPGDDRGEAKQALEEFVNLEPGNSMRAVEFVNRHGLFSDGDRVSFNASRRASEPISKSLSATASVRSHSQLTSTIFGGAEAHACCCALYRTEPGRHVAALRDICTEMHLRLPEAETWRDLESRCFPIWNRRAQSGQVWFCTHQGERDGCGDNYGRPAERDVPRPTYPFITRALN